MSSVRPITVFTCLCCSLWVVARPVHAESPSAEQRQEIQQQLDELNRVISDLPAQPVSPDVRIYAKAAEWILRHDEFFRPGYAADTVAALQTGRKRAELAAAGATPWETQVGSTIRGYVSGVDESVQPYALTLPLNYAADSDTSWPLYVKLHGRNARLNEVSFIRQHDNKPPPAEQDWIQLDVFGRTNNAYRWAGETDVFEAIADVKRRYNIDDRRITLWGFSMGGAGAWHLGLHHPTLWSSVGAGAGFVDFYRYQKQKQRRPTHQHHLLHIYDAVDYALNADTVPVITYGGEHDKQLLASTTMVAAAQLFSIEIAQLIGPNMGHKFDPDSFQKFMAFHKRHSEAGRPPAPERKELRFITYTPKYNRCEWLTVEEMEHPYRPAIITARPVTQGALQITLANIAAMRIDPRASDQLIINGSFIKLDRADREDGSEVIVVKEGEDWRKLDPREAKKFAENPQRRKRHNLQGPIDDAFMQPFVCVRGTGTPWSEAHQRWADWTLQRFAAEFDKWLRGEVIIVDDTAVTEEMIAGKNLVLFGDPGSNSLLAKVLPQLPIDWQKAKFSVSGTDYDPNQHGVSLVYPNPLNPRRYVVLNSGHTFHEPDFKASNAWLFPRLGDVAVQKFTPDEQTAGFREKTVFADVFDTNWQLPSGLPKP